MTRLKAALKLIKGPIYFFAKIMRFRTIGQIQTELLRFQIILAFSVKNCQNHCLKLLLNVWTFQISCFLDFLEVVELTDLLNLLDLENFQSKLEIPTYIHEIKGKFSIKIYNFVETTDNMIQFIIHIHTYLNLQTKS